MNFGKDIGKKVTDFVKKYKYILLVLLIGLVLLMLPSGKGEKDVQDIPEQSIQHESETDYVTRTEERLEAILGKITGVGQVDVMLTLRRGSYTQYQSDNHSERTESTDSTRSDEDQKTVILSEGSAYDTLAVSTVEYPLFQGALIVCSGANSPSVKLDLICAVASLTGLSSDQITVVKMN